MTEPTESLRQTLEGLVTHWDALLKSRAVLIPPKSCRILLEVNANGAAAESVLISFSDRAQAVMADSSSEAASFLAQAHVRIAADAFRSIITGNTTLQRLWLAGHITIAGPPEPCLYLAGLMESLPTN